MGRFRLGKYEEDQNDRAHEQSRGVNFQCGQKPSDSRAVKNLLEVRKFKDVVSKLRFSLTPAEEHMSTHRALGSTGLWRDLVNARELKVRKADGSFA